MERVVLKSLGEVDNLETGALFKFGQIDQTLVGDTALGSLESDIVVWLQSLRNVVGVEQSDLGNLGQSLSAQHLDVCPGDGVDRCRTVRCARNGIDGLFATCGDDWVRGKEWGEV